MVMFQGNVEVVDPQVRMKSDQLVIFFDPDKKEIKSARAEGNVRFYQEDRSATCNKALYMAQIGEVMLLGDARLERPDDVVMADKITFFVSDKALDSVKAEGNVRWKNKGTRGADRKPSETPVRN
jgi:lipopolysaccharide transport protein LptA